MDTGMIPVRYAKALMEFASEKESTDRVYAEMRTLTESFEREPSLRQALDNPMVDSKTKAELIRSAAGVDVSDVFKRFVALVMENKREDLLQQIGLQYLDLYRRMHNISIGRLETAVPVTPETEKRIAGLIASQTKGEVELKTVVKPDLIGGFIFELDFRRLDASIANQLRRIRRQFTEKNKRIV